MGCTPGRSCCRRTLSTPLPSRRSNFSPSFEARIALVGEVGRRSQDGGLAGQVCFALYSESKAYIIKLCPIIVDSLSRFRFNSPGLPIPMHDSRIPISGLSVAIRNAISRPASGVDNINLPTLWSSLSSPFSGLPDFSTLRVASLYAGSVSKPGFKSQSPDYESKQLQSSACHIDPNRTEKEISAQYGP